MLNLSLKIKIKSIKNKINKKLRATAKNKNINGHENMPKDKLLEIFKMREFF